MNRGSVIGAERLLLLFLISLTVVLAGCSKAAKDYNVLFISLDTTRSDYVDSGGALGARACTPELRRFAQSAVVFERAYCTIPQTLPSHLSMFTARFPHECNVLSNQEKFDHRFRMLQEVLKDKGYRTAGIISLESLASGSGISRGFDRYSERLKDGTFYMVPADRITDEAAQVLSRAKEQKFFLFVHYSDPHSPYAPPSASADFRIFFDQVPIVTFNAYQGAVLRKEIPLSPGTHEVCFKLESTTQDFELFVLSKLEFSEGCAVSMQNIEYSDGGSYRLRGPEGKIAVKCSRPGYLRLFQVIPSLTWKAAIDYYRLEVEYMDRHVGRLLRMCETEGLLEDTVVVIAGDHGEGLGERERYFGHVRYLNQQMVWVPLILRLPRVEPARIKWPVSAIAIAPTVLESLGIDDPGFSGRESLMESIRYGVERARPVRTYAFRPSAVTDKLSIVSWPYQCIRQRELDGTVTTEFYNLALSESYRKMDEYSQMVASRNAPDVYRSLLELSRKAEQVFERNTRDERRGLDRQADGLEALGYVQ
ncbi:MAG: sulfatase [Acidobacteriota bacterium]